MEAIKQFVKQCIAYLTANPIHAILIGVAALALVVLLIVIICVSAGAKKRKKAAKAAAAAQKQAAQPAEEVTEAPVEETAAPVEETTETVEEPVETVEEPVEVVEEASETVEVVEEQPVVEEAAEAPTEEAVEEAPIVEETAAPVEETTETVEETAAPVEETTETVEETAAPVEEVVEAPIVEETKEETTTPTKKTAAKKTQKQTPASETAATTSTAQPTPKKTANPKQEGEPKTGVRYAGKWVICKLISVDAQGEEIESAYFFELRASNGELLLSSEEYTSESGAIGGIKTHKTNIEQGRFRIVPSKKGDYIFKLMNAKNTLLCTGANYATRERCERAVESVKRFAATAVLQEDVQELRVKAPVETEEAPVEIVDNGYTGKWIIYTRVDEALGTSYYFELFASNGEKLLCSEDYTTYEGAVNGIDTHKANIEKGNVRISLTKRGDYIFKVLSGNGQLLCLGEHYKTRSRCESAVESVKRFAKTAQVFVEKNN